jgi:hypothetical protein
MELLLSSVADRTYKSFFVWNLQPVSALKFRWHTPSETRSSYHETRRIPVRVPFSTDQSLSRYMLSCIVFMYESCSWGRGVLWRRKSYDAVTVAAIG